MVSDRFATAFQLGLSMVLATAASLSLGWNNPKWAMLAVALCVLATGGESMVKGMYRLTGTAIGATMMLIMLGLFLQFRWGYYAGLLGWVMFCSWKMTGSRAWYIWLIAAMMLPLLSYYSHGNPALAFEDVMLRMQQTGLGVGIYAVVCTLVFPRRTADGFREVLAGELRDQAKVLDELATLYAAPHDQSLDAPMPHRRQAQIQDVQVTRADKIDAAVLENLDFMESRDDWLRLVHEMARIEELTTRWRLGFADLQDPDPDHMTDLPDISPTMAEIHRRLDAAAALLLVPKGARPERDIDIEPRPLQLPEPPALLGDPFGKGALLLSLRTLESMGESTEQLLRSAAGVAGLGVKESKAERRPRPVATIPTSVIPDPDRLEALTRPLFVVGLAFLMLIYIPELPVPGMVVILGTTTSLFLGRMPQIPTAPLLIVGVLGISMAGALHVLIMPHLSSYIGLGTMLFVYCFVIAWTFHQPKALPARFLAIAFMTVIIQLDNENQSYSFLYVANFIIAFTLPVLLLIASSRFPISFIPEHVFNRLFKRYLYSAMALLRDFADNQHRHRGWWARQRHNYHVRQVSRLPGLMDPWIERLPEGLIPGDQTAQLEDLLNALDVLAHRLNEMTADHQQLSESATDPQHPAREALQRELAKWLENVENSAERLLQDPGALRADGLCRLLARRIESLRAATGAAVVAVVEKAERDGTPEALELMQDLAVFRGVSRALLRVAEPAQHIDWGRLREARF